MTKEEKIKSVIDITIKQQGIINKCAEIGKEASWISATALMNNALEIQSLEVQKQIIISQPVPKYDKGCISGVIKESGQEIIIGKP